MCIRASINEVCDVNSFAVDALEAAYNGGEEWLEELKLYLYGNYELVRDMLAERLPQLRVVPVSYTHLDVYKRQRWLISSGCSSGVERNLAKVDVVGSNCLLYTSRCV